MENNLDNFDDRFRERMSDFEPQGAKPDWGAFEQRWAEKEEEAAAAFDRIIRERLRNIDDSSRRAQHWKRMETRLDRAFTLRGKLMRYRVLEAAAAALLIWTASNSLDYLYDNELLMPNKKIAHQENTNKKITNPTLSGTIGAPIVTPRKESDKQRLPQLKNQLNSITAIQATHSFDKTITLQNSVINTIKTTESNLLDIQNHRQNPAKIGQKVGTTEGVVTINENSLLQNLGTTEGVVATSDNSLLEEQHHPQNPIKTGQKTGATEELIATVARRETAVVAPLVPNVREGFDLHLTAEDMLRKTPIIKPLHQNAENPSFARVVMYASATLDNTRNTVNSAVFYGESFDVQANSGGGVNIAFNVDDNLEIETGLAYASKKYTPVQVRKVTGNFDRYVTTNIQHVQLNLVNLPIHVKYRFKRGKHWSFFGLLGGSLNVAAQTSYDTELSLSTPNNERKILVQTEGDRLPQDYKSGLLEGGKFQENYYLTADIGVGAEYKVNKRWSLFVQPTYMHQIGVKGIGPNKDRINTLALQFGSKVVL